MGKEVQRQEDKAAVSSRVFGIWKECVPARERETSVCWKCKSLSLEVMPAHPHSAHRHGLKCKTNPSFLEFQQPLNALWLDTSGKS
eukprot:2340952-Amphidinium_carterae.1